MTKRDRDRRDSQPDQDQSHRAGDMDMQEGESLPALKGILAKVASLLRPMQLTQDESIRLVEQLYENVLDMDVKLAGESDETSKSQVLSHIQNVVVRREADRLVVDYPPAQPQPSERVGATPSQPRSGTTAGPVPPQGPDGQRDLASRSDPDARRDPDAQRDPTAQRDATTRRDESAQRDRTSTRAPAAPPVRESGPSEYSLADEANREDAAEDQSQD